MKVFVKDVLPGNGRFRLTLDGDINTEKIAKMKSARRNQKAKQSRRKEAADLAVGEEILGGVVKVGREDGLVGAGREMSS